MRSIYQVDCLPPLIGDQAKKNGGRVNYHAISYLRGLEKRGLVAPFTPDTLPKPHRDFLARCSTLDKDEKEWDTKRLPLPACEDQKTYLFHVLSVRSSVFHANKSPEKAAEMKANQKKEWESRPTWKKDVQKAKTREASELPCPNTARPHLANLERDVRNAGAKNPKGEATRRTKISIAHKGKTTNGNGESEHTMVDNGRAVLPFD
jgi:hypothetical protein